MTDVLELSQSVKPLVATGTAAGGSLTGDPSQEFIKEWNALLDQFIEWGRHPEKLEDEDIVPPLPAVIALAARLATQLRDLGNPSPTITGPDGEGGISFEFRRGTRTELVVVHPDSTPEIICFENHRIVERSPIRAG